MNIWLGFADQICKVAIHNRWTDVRITLANIDDALSRYTPREAVVHTVGRWWNSNDGIELRNQLKDAGFKFQHHLILKTATSLSGS